MPFTDHIIMNDQTTSVAETDVKAELQRKRYTPISNEPLKIIITEADILFDRTNSKIIGDYWEKVIILLDGPHHRKNKFIERDEALTLVLEAARVKVIRYAYEGRLSQVQLDEILEEVSYYVEPWS